MMRARMLSPGPTVDISDPGEEPRLMSANRAARRAAAAHARKKTPKPPEKKLCVWP